MIAELISFIRVPVRKPTKEPNAALIALSESFPAIFSPINAPTNGPPSMVMIPKGPIAGRKNKPAISPRMLPHAPYFVPPNFFVPQAGTI